jgi:UDP-N-acetylmuramoyl-tripeptide--D-alanyl-D-alanine ligase
MLLLLSTLWFIFELKYILFWLYLWQLKEYHVGRFVDHFRTHKGKKLLFSFGQILKLVLLFFLLLDNNSFLYLYPILFLVYFAELALLFRAILNKSIKKPIRTFKTLFLISVSFAVVILFLLLNLGLQEPAQAQRLLIFDILTPLIVSVIVLLFQPFFVTFRNNVLRKAKEKMMKIKSLSGLKVIAITGSYGKTSTKEFLATMLSEKFKVLSTKEHQNSEIGVARCILDDLKPSHQIFIAEVGAYNKGKVREVCSVLRPDIGVVTGVNEQHMALFGSLENLLSAEGGGELADCLPKDGILAVNGDNKYCLELLKKSSNLPESREKIYALSNRKMDSNIWTEDIETAKDSVSFVAANKNKNLAHFNVKVLGKHNIQNLLGAILVANELGMSFEEISEACKNIKQEQAGMILKHGKHGIDIIDSSYSANPDGVLADLDYLSVFGTKKVIVMPCLIELGKKSSEIHEKIGKKIGEVCDLAIITSKDKFEDIKKGALEAGIKPKNILCLPDGSQATTQEIYSMITLFCKSNDAVLLEGRVPATLIKLLAE